jgi:hypothetical protein
VLQQVRRCSDRFNNKVCNSQNKIPSIYCDTER